MAWETGGGLVRRGGARRTAVLGRLDRGREMRAGPPRQRGMKRGRLGGPTGRWADTGERGGLPRLDQKPEMGQSSKRNSFRISIDFRIWQNFGKLLKEI
jgi:hypothetical protein